MIGLIQINNHKFEITQKIKRILEPRLWESGYIENTAELINAPAGEKPDTVYTRLYTFDNTEDGETFAHVDEFTGMRIEGFTSTGIITDSYCAICVKDFEDCMLEELLFALTIAQTIEEKV